MKKRLALAAAFAFSIIPFTSFADHLEPDESELKNGGELVSTKLEGYDLFSNNLSDNKLIAALTVVNGITHWNGYPIKPGAILQNANLRNADLEGADLSNANLRGANLEGANLKGANLTDANLNDADLKGANLTDANLNDADLSGKELSNTNLSGADLSDANLSDANLIFADLSDANLQYANMSNAILFAADLSDANLQYANLQNANLQNADLSSADLSNAFLSNANLFSADLSGADLSNANLFRADLSDANLSNANLTDVFAENLIGCPSALPVGWVCEDNSLIELEEVELVVVEEEEAAEAEDIDFDSITVEGLPYSVDCPLKNKDLKIKQNKKEKFVVRFASGKKFYNGSNFEKAVDVFEETYEDKCVE